MEKINWHPCYDGSIPMELRKYADMIEFERNHLLNEEPLRIDGIVTKKRQDVKIEKNFGRIFRKYNLFEYKSPKAALDIDVFFKVNAYACLYKAYGDGVNAIKQDEITITFIRDIKPEKLFKDLEAAGYIVENKYPGIYYILGNQFFPTQVLVGRELPAEENPWFKCLTFKAVKEDFLRLLKERKNAACEGDRQHIDTIFQAMTLANMNVYRELLEDKDMMNQITDEFMKATGLDIVIAEKDRDIAEKDRDIAEKDRDIAEKDKYLAEKDKNIAEMKTFIDKLLAENASLKAEKQV